MSAPVETPPPEAAPGARECPRCGSAAAPMQEYCLECGAHLPPGGGGPAGRALGAWAWSALVTAAVAVVAAGAVVAVRANDDERPSLVVATQPQPPVPEETAPEPVPTAPVPPEETAPEPETQPPPPPAASQIVAWPEGTRGWTVVLASIPVDQGRPVATRRAKEAADAGLAQVGVLVSSRYSSLHPGYFVVFAGVYDSQRQAEQGVALAARSGLEAYPREIVP